MQSFIIVLETICTVCSYVPLVQKNENKMFFAQTNKVLIFVLSIDPPQQLPFSSWPQNHLSAGEVWFQAFLSGFKTNVYKECTCSQNVNRNFYWSS